MVEVLFLYQSMRIAFIREAGDSDAETTTAQLLME